MRRRSGYTLMELVVSMTAISLLVGSMAAVTSIAGRAAPMPGDAHSEDVRVRAALERISADMVDALQTQVSADSLTLLVPDRDADSNPETIVYQWGGAGRSLAVSTNGGSQIDLTGALDAFELSPSVLSWVDEVVLGQTEGEKEVRDYYDWLIKALAVEMSVRRGESITGIIEPAGSLGRYTPTELKVRFTENRWANDDDMVWIELRTVDPGVNSLGPVLASWLLTDVPGGETTLKVDPVYRLRANQSLAVVLSGAGSGGGLIATVMGRPSSTVDPATATTAGVGAHMVDAKLKGRPVEPDSVSTSERLVKVDIHVVSTAGPVTSITASPMMPIPVEVK